MRIARLARLDGPPLYAELSSDGRALPWSDAPWRGGTPKGEAVAWSEGDLLVPLDPSKIVCVGRNYAAHARELGHDIPQEPLLFLKPPSALLAPGGAIVLPRESSRVDHEAELGVVIGSRAKNLSPGDALGAVFGYTCAGDITARDLQKKDGQWTRAKGFDTFCPVGPWIETELDPRSRRVRCLVNGELRPEGTTEAMLFPVPDLVAYVSRMMTLEPGDLILTGTPEGVGPLAPGDRLAIEVEGIGTLACRVRD